jgi:hypothetical protein
MTTTLTDMINEVSMNLSGYTLTQDRATHLTAAVTTTTSTIASPLILSLGSTDNVGKGVVEIDEELLFVDNFDRVGNTATVSPFGRGYLGTTPDTHISESKVTISPTFPRFSIKRAINDTIKGLSGTLFAADTTTITYNSAVSTYRLPDTGTSLNIRNILSVAYESIGPSKEWIPIRSWRFDANANSGSFTSEQSISIYDMVTSGRTIQIVFLKTQHLSLPTQIYLQHKLDYQSLVETWLFLVLPIVCYLTLTQPVLQWLAHRLMRQIANVHMVHLNL